MIPFQEITEENFAGPINEVLSNPKYTNRGKEFGAMAVDQIQHPLERDGWWLEHIMSHPHEYRHKSPTLKLPWYQYFCIDVILTLFASFVRILFVSYKRIKCCHQLCCKLRKVKPE